MSRTLALATVVVALLAGAFAAPASAEPVFGVGDQKADMFRDARFAELGMRHARRVVPWDALHVRWQREELDDWMAAAKAAGVEPLIAFTRSRRKEFARTLPNVWRMRRTFRKFRRRYRWVQTYIPWNEANHRSQPTWRSPRRAAQYYEMMRATCRRCTILGADVLDTPDMVSWVRRFRRWVGHEPKVWGLHNYLDANHFRTVGTRRFLREVPGEVWFTEVGGIVSRKRLRERGVRANDSARHAARVTRWLFHLADISPRVKRVYVYHWNAGRAPHEEWDSGLIAANGKPRPAFNVLAQELRRRARAAARRARQR